MAPTHSCGHSHVFVIDLTESLETLEASPYTSYMQVCAEVLKTVDEVMQPIAVHYARTAFMEGDVLVVEVRFLGRSWVRRCPDPERLSSLRFMREILADPLKEWAVRGLAMNASMLRAQPARTLTAGR